MSAACDTTLTLTTSGDANWFRTTASSYRDYDSAQSGALSNNQGTLMKATVMGPGSLSFAYLVSCGEGDYFGFSADGIGFGVSNSGLGWQTYSCTLGPGPHTLTWGYGKGFGEEHAEDFARVDAIVWTPGSSSPSSLVDAVDTSLYMTTDGDSSWFRTTSVYYSGGDSAQSGPVEDDQGTTMYAYVDGPGSGSFRWKVSSQADCDYLEFYIDGRYQEGLSGEVNWTQKTFTTTGSGWHELSWRYSRDDWGYYAGQDCGWVDALQWTSSGPAAPPWTMVEYVYDPSGRRIAKTFDGVVTRKYVYDGDSIIAEYDGNDVLLRKFIQGAGIDQPVSMIDVEHASATYYYHYDALGNVVALSNAGGTTVEVYEYSAFGEVAASDQTNPNPFMFTGREFDKETGLYCYRARYYAPEIGRFLQTDPIGYKGGMNLYWYCMNNPWNLTDPYGDEPNEPNAPDEPYVDRCAAQRKAFGEAVNAYNDAQDAEDIQAFAMSAQEHAMFAASAAVTRALVLLDGALLAVAIACKGVARKVTPTCIGAIIAAGAAGAYVWETSEKLEAENDKFDAEKLKWKKAVERTDKAWENYVKAEDALRKCEQGSAGNSSSSSSGGSSSNGDPSNPSKGTYCTWSKGRQQWICYTMKTCN